MPNYASAIVESLCTSVYAGLAFIYPLICEDVGSIPTRNPSISLYRSVILKLRSAAPEAYPYKNKLVPKKLLEDGGIVSIRRTVKKEVHPQKLIIYVPKTTNIQTIFSASQSINYKTLLQRH